MFKACVSNDLESTIKFISTQSTLYLTWISMDDWVNLKYNNSSSVIVAVLEDMGKSIT